MCGMCVPALARRKRAHCKKTPTLEHFKIISQNKINQVKIKISMLCLPKNKPNLLYKLMIFNHVVKKNTPKN